MVNLEEWKANKQFQQEYEAFRNTNCGEALTQVLVSCMLDSWPQLNKEASVIEVEAMSASFVKGYRACFKMLDALRPSNIGTSAEATIAKEFTPTGLPLSEEIKKRVEASLPKRTPKKEKPAATPPSA